MPETLNSEETINYSAQYKFSTVVDLSLSLFVKEDTEHRVWPEFSGLYYAYYYPINGNFNLENIVPCLRYSYISHYFSELLKPHFRK
jgi:hypothetical protein